MPDYEYYCPACAHEFTAFRDMCERTKRTTCPKCGHRNCARVASAVNTQFNGHGFYTTDHRSCDKNG